MNLKRFTGRNTKEAMAKVREAFGEDAVVVSTRPCSKGIEIVAMPSDTVASLDRWVTQSASLEEPAAQPAGEPELGVAARMASRKPAAETSSVKSDVEKLAMSTLSFQEYVRERMLKRRKVALGERQEPAPEPVPASAQAIERRLTERDEAQAREAQKARAAEDAKEAAREAREAAEARKAADAAEPPRRAASKRSRRMPDLVDTGFDAVPSEPAPLHAHPRDDRAAMMNELRAMKGLIEDRFGALAFVEKMQRSPAHARLTQKMLEFGFSPGLVRKLAEGIGPDVSDEITWAAKALERNLGTDDGQAHLEDTGGVFAMIGSTGVGKTTTTAKLAAAFAARHGANNLGLITLDAYRVAAHEQLRAYGRILGVPVHTAHDRVALEDLLELLSAKKMILIDTAGIAQRDSRTKDLLEMLANPAIKRLLVVNAAAQGETIDDVMVSYRAAQAHGVILSKVDEAVKLGPALDAVIRHHLTIRGVANGQRVPEDWHHLSANALLHRAMRASSARAFRLDASDVNLVFTTPNAHATAPRDVR